MIANAAATDPSQKQSEQILAELVEQFAERFEAGESPDPSEFAAEHPEFAEALRQLLPALRAVN